MPLVFANPSHRPSPALPYARGNGVGLAVATALLFAAGAGWFVLAPTRRPRPVAAAAVAPQAKGEPDAVPAAAKSGPLDPKEGLTLILREADSPARKLAFRAALRAWTRLEPEAAAGWVLAQTDLDLTEAMTEIFAAIDDLPRALSLAEYLAQVDATQARDYGYALISSLNRRGEFVRSADYAATAPTDVRRDLLIAAYYDWGNRQPEQALISATQVADPVAGSIALQSVLSGWARTDPEGLADIALHFPEGDEQLAALTKAVRAWMIKDPWKAGDWVLAHSISFPAAKIAMRED